MFQIHIPLMTSSRDIGTICYAESAMKLPSCCCTSCLPTWFNYNWITWWFVSNTSFSTTH